jgi:hypothetical protein
MAVEMVEVYQTDRLRDNAAPKSINDEVGFLLRLLGGEGRHHGRQE